VNQLNYQTKFNLGPKAHGIIFGLQFRHQIDTKIIVWHSRDKEKTIRPRPIIAFVLRKWNTWPKEVKTFNNGTDRLCPTMKLIQHTDTRRC